MKVAIVHDCLTVSGGAEKVLKEMIFLFPQADLFALVNFLPDFSLEKKVRTSFIQKIPFSKRNYRWYFPLMPLAVESFDLSSYDLILSSSYAVAKGVITSPEQLHICYCHSPMRYVWDFQDIYLKNLGWKKFFAKGIFHKMRIWDVSSAQRVDRFIANSEFVKARIMKIYRRKSQVIYPPVNVARFSPYCFRQDFYLTCSRLLAYKRVDLIINAFKRMPQKKLIVIGDGPEYRKLKNIASRNIIMIRKANDEQVKEYMETAKGFVFAAKEDFGIVCVEAQSAGCGVIAFGQGGALETVKGLDERRPTGCFFYQQTIEALIFAIEQFEINLHRITSENCRQNAERFSQERFREELLTYIHQELNTYESDFTGWGERRAPMAHFEKNLSEAIFPH